MIDTHAAWQVVLGMGAVVLAVVIILMMLLLSFIKDIRVSVDTLLTRRAGLAAQTSNLTKLKATPACSTSSSPRRSSRTATWMSLGPTTPHQGRSSYEHRDS